ncbi:MAG TPA: DUF1569 domain-containing protein [Longimicrobiales bacterium]|nr:DUF1569 domain-containing protein [Longimicrobiales bacterium]
MSELDTVLADNRAAVDELVRAAEAAHANWSTPADRGKWSPAQVVEHVARSLEEAAKLVSGKPHRLPKAPVILRPLMRLVFHRTARTGEFPKPKTKTTPELDPESGPATPADAKARLEAALATFERACREREGQMAFSESFGRVQVEDYARFTAAHTRHHTRQIPVVI